MISDLLLYLSFNGLQLPVVFMFLPRPSKLSVSLKIERKEGKGILRAFNRPFSFQPAIMDKL